MSNFPKLIPAFTAMIHLNKGIGLGAVSSSGPLDLVSFVPSGSLISEPSYSVKVNATFIHGADYIRQDPSGKHLRLDVHSTLKDKDNGSLIKMSYTGIIELNQGIVAALTGAPEAKTTQFGDIFTHVVFETGSDPLRAMEEKVFVGSGRFVVEEGKPLVVEYKISQLAL